MKGGWWCRGRQRTAVLGQALEVGLGHVDRGLDGLWYVGACVRACVRVRTRAVCVCCV